MVINESTAYKRDYKKIIINKHMIKEKEKIEKLSMNINQKVKEQFSWDITAKKIAETIKYKKQ